MEPLGVAAKAVEEAIFHIRAGMPRSMLILGGGPIGLGVSAIARMKGFRTVVAEIDPSRRQQAAGFCDLAVESEAPFSDPNVRDILGHGGASVVIDACGAVGPRHIELVRPVGVFVCLARTGSQPLLPVDTCMSRGVTIKCTRGHVGHLETVIDWLCDGTLDPSPFITRRLTGLRDLAAWLQRPAKFGGELKVVAAVNEGGIWS